jgi:hypothetical protein
MVWFGVADLIFKNQAAGTEDKNKKKEFVNDLLRTEFHRKFMGKCVDLPLSRVSSFSAAALLYRVLTLHLIFATMSL